MRNCLRIGDSYSFEVVITPDMQAEFAGVVVHELYSTAAMLTQMEWAARQLLLPGLEAGKEGFGYHMNIDHMAPTRIGKKVVISATITGVLKNRLICWCEAHSDGRKVGQAKVVQAVVEANKVLQP